MFLAPVDAVIPTPPAADLSGSAPPPPVEDVRALVAQALDQARTQLERKALEKARAQVQAEMAQKGAAAPAVQAQAAPPAPGNRQMTSERQALINKALAIRRSQEKLLDVLSPEQRARLVATATRAFLFQAEPPGGSGGKGGDKKS
jgi:hypothetical protein